MESHLLEYIEIKNFKCFDDFKAEGFKQVNLIGGKNNVGKTAFMEACYVNVYAQGVKSFLFPLARIKFRREIINAFSATNVTLSDFVAQNIKNFIEQSNQTFTHQKDCIQAFLDCSEFKSKENHKTILNDIYKLAYPKAPFNFQHRHFDELKQKLAQLLT